MHLGEGKSVIGLNCHGFLGEIGERKTIKEGSSQGIVYVVGTLNAARER